MSLSQLPVILIGFRVSLFVALGFMFLGVRI